MHSQFFLLAIGRGMGWLEKSRGAWQRCRRYNALIVSWKREYGGNTQRERDIRPRMSPHMESAGEEREGGHKFYSAHSRDMCVRQLYRAYTYYFPRIFHYKL